MLHDMWDIAFDVMYCVVLETLNADALEEWALFFYFFLYALKADALCGLLHSIYSILFGATECRCARCVGYRTRGILFYVFGDASDALLMWAVMRYHVWEALNADVCDVWATGRNFSNNQQITQCNR